MRKLQNKAKLFFALLLDNSAALSVKGCGKGDDDARDTAVNSTQGIFYLREHATANGAVGFIFYKVRVRDNWDNGIVIVRITQDTFFLKTEDERDVIIGSEGLGGLAGNCIRIGIEDIPLTIMGQWCHHGGDAFLDEFAEHLTVGLVNIAYEAEIDTVLNGALVAVDDIHISTCETQGIHAIGLETGHEILVDQLHQCPQLYTKVYL